MPPFSCGSQLYETMSMLTEARNNRILIIDDNPSIHADIRKILGERDGENPELDRTKFMLFGDAEQTSPKAEFEIESAYQGREGLEMMKTAAKEGRPFALAFVDVRMPPGWDGVETIGRLWEDFPDLQVVICTAYSDYSWEEMIRRLGHSASLVILKKPFDNIEVMQLAHALTEKWQLNRRVHLQLEDRDTLVRERTLELETTNGRLKREIAARIEAEDVLRLSEERFSKAFSASPIPMAIQSWPGEILVDANEAFLTMLEGDRSRVLSRTPVQLGMWQDLSLSQRAPQILKDQSSVRNIHCTVRTLTGQERQALLSIEPFELGSGPHLLVILQDISEQLKLESQLRQSQKMEAVGQLAAGVAHDFNNILTAIQGHTSLLQAQLGEHPNFGRQLHVISLAAERATRLIRQLLAFSRKQVLKPQVVHLEQVTANLADMLRRLLGEHIQLEVTSNRPLPPIRADLSMMEQIILNLAVNSRDAMPRGGLLSIHTDVVSIAAADAGHPDVPPGDYVRLTVLDNGAGIPQALLPRIFDPFFTTKEIGKGTGLGLATVYGIVKQHNGMIDVNSEPGEGTRFRIHLPAAEDSGKQSQSLKTDATVRNGTECILMVEDEDIVRTMAAAVLREQGYRVLEAATGRDAIEIFRQHKEEIHLLFTDFMMPGNMLGDELAARLRDDKPSLAVLFTSGYTPDVANTELHEGENLLAKPFTPSQMLSMVRRRLDRAHSLPARECGVDLDGAQAGTMRRKD